MEKEIRKMGRGELQVFTEKLYLESQTLRKENETLKEQIQSREIHLQEAGSIAEAALQINGIFDAAQNAAEDYLENLKRLSDGAQAQADALLEETRKKCEIMETAAQKRAAEKLAETREECLRMSETAKQEANAQWESLKSRLDQYFQAHEGLKEQLGTLFSEVPL